MGNASRSAQARVSRGGALSSSTTAPDDTAPQGIAEGFLSPQIRQKAHRTNAVVERLQAGWPEAIVLRAAKVSIYDYFPFLFMEAFPGVEDEALESFAVAARLYASSIFLHDKVFDEIGGPTTHLAPVNALRILAMQWEAYRILHLLFPPESRFWPLFQRYLGQFAEAGLQEQRFALGDVSWKEFSEDRATEIAIGKNGVAKATLAGLAVLGDDDRHAKRLTEAIDRYSFARQMFDDLCDWEEDLRAGTPSLLLARLVDSRPAIEDPKAIGKLVGSLGRRIYYGGHAHYVLELALESLDRATRLAASIPGLTWQKIPDELRKRCELFLQDADRIIEENVRRVGKQPRFTLSLPQPKGRWQELAWGALGFILPQWRLGFGEARHIMEFPHEMGFSAEEQYQRGDVFQRAVIATALCDVDELAQGALTPVIDDEISYLVGRRGPARGGWRYFPELPDLPPDADDLGQIVQLLFRRGRLRELEDSCRGPLSILLTDNAHSDGSFETWIIPASDRTPEEERQVGFARLVWGTGPDADVMANLLYALVLLGETGFREAIGRGAEHLETRQEENGSWLSTWYHGPYYGTWVCLRLLSLVAPGSRAIPKGLSYLRESQRGDGGWGIGDSSDALSTAFALLGLGAVEPVSATDEESAERALEYLARSQQADRSWPSCEYIRMEMGRATGEVVSVLSYGSRTISTSFVMQAAAKWHRLTMG